MAFGHPRGLFPLFFIEMWERHSFYLLGFLLLLYLQAAGGHQLSRADASEIVGTYLAFVYFTPFLGGLIADRYLGFRRSVLIGGLCMAGGLWALSMPAYPMLVAGLALVCVGNGFFKPNISAMVGNIYPKGDPRRDAGFNIFYMGINIGAFLAPITAAIARNEWSWATAFQSAAVGLLIGCALLLVFWRSLEPADRMQGVKPGDFSMTDLFLKILLPAALVGVAGYWVRKALLPGDFPVSAGMFGFLSGMVPILLFFVRLGRTAAPEERDGLKTLMPVFLAGGTFFMILHMNVTALTTWGEEYTVRHTPNPWNVVPYSSQDAGVEYFANAGSDAPRPDERTLVKVEEPVARMFAAGKMDQKSVAAVIAAGQVAEVVIDKAKDGLSDADRDRLAKGSTEVFPDGTVAVASEVSHGQTVWSVKVPVGTVALRRVALAKTIDGARVATIPVSEASFAAMYKKAGTARIKPGDRLPVTNTEFLSQANAFCVVAFTPLLVAFFQWLVRKGRPVSTARKIFYGLLLTAISMAFMIVPGILSEGGAAKVSWLWLVGAYAIMTVGELCLSPMGLSLVTKLSPQRLVGLMMGGWFVATAFGNKLSGFLGGIQALMDPMWFFAVLAVAVLLVALYIRALLPRMDEVLKRYGA